MPASPALPVAPTISWVTAFLDFPPDRHEVGLRFWSAVTGYAASPARGGDGEFATLLPPDGDAHLRVQRVRDGEPRIHVDLHVANLDTQATRVTGLGAVVVATLDGVVVLRSPGGFVFCLVEDPAHRQPGSPATWSDPPGDGITSMSIVDQVCLDIPVDRYDDEVVFWHAVVGWSLTAGSAVDEFQRLVRPEGVTTHLLLQRLETDSSAGATSAHLDLAASDRAAEVARHERLGATAVADLGRGWTVLRDPAGAAYCITDRKPGTRGGGQPVASLLASSSQPRLRAIRSRVEIVRS